MKLIEGQTLAAIIAAATIGFVLFSGSADAQLNSVSIPGSLEESPCCKGPNPAAKYKYAKKFVQRNLESKEIWGHKRNLKKFGVRRNLGSGVRSNSN